MHQQQQQQHPIPLVHIHYFHTSHCALHGSAIDEKACFAVTAAKNQKNTLCCQCFQPMSLHDQHHSGYPTLHAAAPPALTHASTSAANHGYSSNCALSTLLTGTPRCTDPGPGDRRSHRPPCWGPVGAAMSRMRHPTGNQCCLSMNMREFLGSTSGKVNPAV